MTGIMKHYVGNNNNIFNETANQLISITNIG